MMKLDLAQIKNYDYIKLKNITDEYNINVVGDNNAYWCYDSDLETLFDEQNIQVTKSVFKVREFKFNELYEPIGCYYGDYLYTCILEQNNIFYECQVFCVYNGSGADEGLLIQNIKKYKNITDRG